MKQTVEEAAMNFANYESNNLDKLPFKVKTLVDYDNGLTRGFKKGADWQAKQSPWISVKERLPKEGQKVFVLVMCYGTPCIREEKFCRNSNLDKKGMWIHGNSIVLAWFPIPSFDEILEANKDVLERIKEKGVKNEIS
jgi:hypothetical protein